MVVDVLDSHELIELIPNEEPKEELELKEEPVLQEVYLERKGFEKGVD